MKKLFLTMASLLMLASMTIAQNETPMLPESHGALTHQPAWGSSQTFDMAAGWTWWSTFISTTDLQTLENALGVNGKTIKYSTGQVQKTASGIWDGTLSSFASALPIVVLPAPMYPIRIMRIISSSWRVLLQSPSCTLHKSAWQLSRACS